MSGFIKIFLCCLFISNVVAKERREAFDEGDDHFIKSALPLTTIHHIASIFTIRESYVEKAYKVLQENQFKRDKTLEIMSAPQIGKSHRESSMRIRTVDRLIEEHILLKDPEKFSESDLKRLLPQAENLDSIKQVSLHNDALIDANFEFKRALDFAIRRQGTFKNMEEYLEKATESQKYIEFLLSKYATGSLGL